MFQSMIRRSETGKRLNHVLQYGKLVDGIFLDDVNVLPGTLSYYATLNSYVRGLNPSYLVASNPGQPFLNGVSPADYLSVADVIDLFEGPDKGAPGAAGFNNYPYGLNWFLDYPNQHFEDIVFDVRHRRDGGRRSDSLL
jgi:hypothetical protein